MVRSVADGRPPLIPEWNEQKALGALNIQRVEFEDLDGNTQGYAKRGGKIAVSPIAALPHKTLFHEIAHSLLHCGDGDLSDTENTPHDVREVEAEAVALLCCESLGLPGAEFSRGYIQAFLKTGGQGQAISGGPLGLGLIGKSWPSQFPPCSANWGCGHPALRI